MNSSMTCSHSYIHVIPPMSRHRSFLPASELPMCPFPVKITFPKGNSILTPTIIS